ncbi:MAG: glycosyltransferase [Candidatus Bathyarchaeia archaeon]
MLKNYSSIVGKAELRSIETLAEKLGNVSITHINSTRFGGGVAEILKSLVPLQKSLGMKTSWIVMRAPRAFFEVTKSFHNALQGALLPLDDTMKNLYLEFNEKNARRRGFEADFVTVHDPQPAALVKFCNPRVGKWLWRCHVDLTSPNPDYWKYLSSFLDYYDALIFSLDRYVKNAQHKRALVISPSIDPLTEKNRTLSGDQISKVVHRFDVNPEKPILTQVARFDPLKNPLGAIDVYRMVKQKIPSLQLVLIGSMADDDPEGIEWRRKTLDYAKGDGDIKVLSNLAAKEVNAFQRASSVIIQMSLSEGFGITVTEALWKGVPVVASRVGGIPLQVLDGFTGYLGDSTEQAAARVGQLLNNRRLASQLGRHGHDHVKLNFLITRQLKQYLQLYIQLLEPTHS